MSKADVLLFGQNALLGHRVSDLLKGNYKTFLQTSNDKILFNAVNKSANIVVIYDCDGDSDQTSTIRKLKQMHDDIPLIAMSSNNHKNFFLQVLLEGATDFILKPFDDSFFVNKIIPYLSGHKKSNASMQITFNFSEYLMGEIEKAQKGNFPLSIMFLTYGTKDGGATYDSSEDINTYLFNNFHELFWRTDVFLHFGKKYYIGVFPFCDHTNSDSVQKKVQKKYEDLQKQSPFLECYQIYTVFAVYPYDASNWHQLGDILVNRAKVMIDDMIDLSF
jgi:DNA-binding NarL/FixJ family response regulator